MPNIKLKVSQEAAAEWEAFLRTQEAVKLDEAGLLGDWALLGLVREAKRYFKEGGPAPPKSEHEMAEKIAALARKRLSKAQRRVLPMFNENDQVSVAEMSRVLGITPGEGREFVDECLARGFLAPGPGREDEPTYVLSPDWQVHNLSGNRPSLNAPRTFETLAQYKRHD